MNINTEKQNLYLFSGQNQAEAFSPYLSPLLANSNSKDFQEQDQIMHFSLNAEEIQIRDNDLQQQYLIVEEVDNQNSLDLIAQINNNFEEQLILYNNAILQTSEKKPAYSVGKKDTTKIYSIINFLVDNDELPEGHIKQAGKQLYQDSPILAHIFTVMLSKLKKLRKTKQQMTKFCMRKAFKFVSDSHNQSKKKRKNSKEESENQNFGFEMPFRKNSTEKTMNAQFLKQVFSKEIFVEQYKKFLENFHEIILQDNQYKIKYLSDTIESFLKSESENNMKKIQQIKRLPWTKSILNKTQQLAYSLLRFSEGTENEHQKEEEEDGSGS